MAGASARPVSVISIETPVRRRSGETFDQRELDRITAFARREGIRLHLERGRACSCKAPIPGWTSPSWPGRSTLSTCRSTSTSTPRPGPSWRARLPSSTACSIPAECSAADSPPRGPSRLSRSIFLPGFIDRFTKAVAVSESFIAEVTRHEAFRVERMAGGTNLFRLWVAGAEAEAFRRRLGEQQVDLGGVRPDGGFMVGVNETWNRSEPDELAHRFRAALG